MRGGVCFYAHSGIGAWGEAPPAQQAQGLQRFLSKILAGHQEAQEGPSEEEQTR